MNVPAEMLERNEPAVPAPSPPREDDELRAWAARHVERVRKLRRDVVVYALAMVTLTVIWALVEWQDNGAFERFSGGNNPGDWEPWVLYVALIWGFFLVLDAVKTHFDRPTTDAEIENQIERLRARR
jgi:hypothetical protein